MNQLVRVNDPNDPTAGASGTTCVYTYDSGWKDQLKTVTKYDTTVSPLVQTVVANFEHDAIGNPEVDGNWTYTWKKGRQLKSMHNGSTGVTMEFRYNSEGIRTQKVKKVNGVVEETINYILSGKKIVSLSNSDETMYFTYDASGAPATVIYNGATFTYVKNLQGDIVGIADANGDIVVKYQYDAWGKLIKTSGILRTVLGKVNPFRYRGYVWDEETGLYYLRSRYYNSKWDRFLNADRFVSTSQKINSANMFAYCKNSPVFYTDKNGYALVSCFDENSMISDYAPPMYVSSSGLGKAKAKKREPKEWALYDNKRFDKDNVFHEQLFVVTTNLPEASLSDLSVEAGVEFDFITGGWEGEYVDASLLDFGHAEASFSFSPIKRKIEASAMVSVWSPSISVTIFGVEIELSTEIGSIGAEVGGDISTDGGLSLKLALGLGLGISFDW